MGTISTVNPSPGTETSEIIEVLVSSDKILSQDKPIEVINITSSGDTAEGEITIEDNFTILGFKFVLTSPAARARDTDYTLSFWSTDDLLADVGDDGDWIKFFEEEDTVLSDETKTVVTPVITSLVSRKLRAKCEFAVTPVGAETAAVIIYALVVS